VFRWLELSEIAFRHQLTLALNNIHRRFRTIPAIETQRRWLRLIDTVRLPISVLSEYRPSGGGENAAMTGILVCRQLPPALNINNRSTPTAGSKCYKLAATTSQQIANSHRPTRHNSVDWRRVGAAALSTGYNL